MSWDVVVLNLGGEPPPADAADADPIGPLGTAAQVRRRIAKHLPGVDWSEGVYEGDGFTIEFNIEDDDPIDSLELHVRGGGDAIAALLRFANPNGWALLDCTTSEFLDPENPSAAGWEGFQAFRDKAIGRPKSTKPKGKAKQTKEKQPKRKAKPPKRKAKRKGR